MQPLSPWISTIAGNYTFTSGLIRPSCKGAPLNEISQNRECVHAV